MYADDIVLPARRKAELKEMLKRFRRFLERRDLSLSPDKDNGIRKRKDKNKEEKMEMERGRIEEIKQITYLAYMMQKNGEAEKHIGERIQRPTIAIKRTWSKRKRIFKKIIREERK